MAEKKSAGGTVMVLIIFALLGVGAYLLAPLWKNLHNKQDELKKTQSELHRQKKIESEKRKINEGLENSPAAVEKVAREKFNMVRPGEKIIFYDKRSRDDSTRNTGK